MKKIFFLPLLFAALLPLCPGCRTAVTTEGDPCYGLSRSDQEELVEVARASLLRPNKIVTPEEMVRIRNSEPEIDIRYNGDPCLVLECQIRTPPNNRMVEVTPKETEVIHNYHPEATQTYSPKSGRTRSLRASGSR